MLGKAWQAVLDQGVGETWKRPGSGPEGAVQLLAEAAITLKDPAPWPFAREVHLLKAPQPRGASWAASIQNTFRLQPVQNTGMGGLGMQMISLRGSTPERRVTNMKVMFKMGAGSGAAGEDPRRKSGSFRDPAARRGVGVTERTASSPQGGFTCS